MHIRLHCLETFLVGHTKALFFIDNDQAESLKINRLGEQSVGANHDIHFAAGQAFLGFLGLRSRNQT